MVFYDVQPLSLSEKKKEKTNQFSPDFSAPETIRTQ
jgi:hypothetical protein